MQTPTPECVYPNSTHSVLIVGRYSVPFSHPSSPEEVLDASVSALRAQGFEFRTLDRENGVLISAPELVRRRLQTHTMVVRLSLAPEAGGTRGHFCAVWDPRVARPGDTAGMDPTDPMYQFADSLYYRITGFRRPGTQNPGGGLDAPATTSARP